MTYYSTRSKDGSTSSESTRHHGGRRTTKRCASLCVFIRQGAEREGRGGDREGIGGFHHRTHTHLPGVPGESQQEDRPSATGEGEGISHGDPQDEGDRVALQHPAGGVVRTSHAHPILGVRHGAHLPILLHHTSDEGVLLPEEPQQCILRQDHG